MAQQTYGEWMRSNPPIENPTAVEWLVDKLMKGEFINNPDELIEQAKQMEKEQIMRAYEFGVADPYNFIEDEAEQYYNETYQNK